MAQVPYNPTPTVEPTSASTPAMREDAPPAAFGVNIAQSVQNLGQSLTSTGNELFGRAVALKQLDNESEARDADTQYMIEVGKRHADFSTLEGKQRADALPAYMKGLEDLRKQYRGNLSNDMARRMFDANSLSTMGRTIFNGAGQAASGAREYSVNTIKANLEITAKQNEDDPTDDGLLQDSLRKAQDYGRQLAGLSGAPPGSAIEQRVILETQSKMLKGRINGLANGGKIDAAADFLDKYKTNMTQDDYNVAAERVKTADRTIGTSVIANDVWGRMSQTTFDKPAATLADMEDEARKMAQKRRPDDQVFADHAAKAVQSKYYLQRNAEVAYRNQLTQDVSGFILQNKPSNVQEFRALPGGDDFYQKMRPSDQLALPKTIANATRIETQESNFNEYKRLKGMANNPNQFAEFLTQDPMTDWKVDKNQWNSLFAERKKLIQAGVADPHVGRAFNWLKDKYGPTMQDLKLIGPGQDQDEHNKLWGSVSDAIDAWRETKKVTPSYDEFMNKIAPAIMQEHTVKGWFFNSKERGFQTPVTDEMREKIIQDYKRAGQEEPNDVAIQHEYNRRMFKNLFEGMKTQDKYGK